MTTYLLRWTECHHSYVEAESEAAVRQAWEDGNVDSDDSHVDGLDDVTEVDDHGVEVTS